MPGHLYAERVNCSDHHYPPMAKLRNSYSLYFLGFKQAATIMCEYRFAIKSMFSLCATHRINKCTLQQLFLTFIASGICYN